MTFPPHIESKFTDTPANVEANLRAWQREENRTEVEYIAAKEIVYKLAQIRAEIMKDKIREQLKQAA